MLNTKLATVFATFAIGIACTGCTPKSSRRCERPYDPVEMGWGITELNRANTPLTVKQAKVLLRSPDRVMEVSGFPEFLAGQPGWDKKLVLEGMRELYKGFLWSEEQRGNTVSVISSYYGTGWELDKSFLGCTVWLYGRLVKSPEAVTTGGVFPRTIIEGGVLYLLIKDDAVVYEGVLMSLPSGK